MWPRGNAKARKGKILHCTAEAIGPGGAMGGIVRSILEQETGRAGAAGNEPKHEVKTQTKTKKENMNTQPIVVQRLLQAPVDRVWKAITDKNEMKQWYFDLAEFRAEKGFTFQFTGGPSPEKQYLHVCEVTEAIPNKKLSYSWRYEGYAGISHVTFELKEQGGQTLLTLTHTGLESFPQENPDFAANNFRMGWDDIINQYLKNHVEGTGQPASAG